MRTRIAAARASPLMSTSGVALERRRQQPGMASPSVKEEKARRRAERRARLLYLSAAMPLPALPRSELVMHYSPRMKSELREVIETFAAPFRSLRASRPRTVSKPLSPMGSAGSASSMRGQHQQLEAPQYPWQYRMRMTPQQLRRRSMTRDTAVLMALTQNEDTERREMDMLLSRDLAAKPAAAAPAPPPNWIAQMAAKNRKVGADDEVVRAVQPDENIRETQRREGHMQNKVKAKVDVKAEQAKANAAKVEEAGAAAQAAAITSPVLTVAELLKMRQSRVAMKEALLEEAHALSKDELNHLRFRLGEAILASGKTIAQLVKGARLHSMEGQVTLHSMRVTRRLAACLLCALL